MKRVSSPQRSQTKKNGAVRIIAGQYRGRKLPVPNIEGLRPTTDRNKETLFNWLMHDLPGAHCLDVFAGSGGLGFEALSRYAAHCVFLEKDKQVAAQLQTNLNTLQAAGTVKQGDAMGLLTTLQTPFDIIFVDPPFAKGLVLPTLDALLKDGLVKPNGLLYVEQETEAPRLTLPPTLHTVKEKKLAQVTYALLRYIPESSASAN